MGDIITFFTDDDDPRVAGKTITHRVISISVNDDGKYRFKTQGDNKSTNPNPDDLPARGEKLVGRYVCGILPLTAIVTLFQTHLPVALLATVLIPTIILTQRGVRRKMKAIPAEREELIKQRVAEELARLNEEQSGTLPPPDDKTNTR